MMVDLKIGFFDWMNFIRSNFGETWFYTDLCTKSEMQRHDPERWHAIASRQMREQLQLSEIQSGDGNGFPKVLISSDCEIGVLEACVANLISVGGQDWVKAGLYFDQIAGSDDSEDLQVRIALIKATKEVAEISREWNPIRSMAS